MIIDSGAITNFVLSIGAGLLTGWVLNLFHSWWREPWTRWHAPFRSNLNSVKGLDRAIQTLSQIGKWIEGGDGFFTDQLGPSIWRTINLIEFQQWTLIVLYSRDSEDREWHLNQLARVDDQIATSALEKILGSTPSESAIHALAEKHLREVAR